MSSVDSIAAFLDAANASFVCPWCMVAWPVQTGLKRDTQQLSRASATTRGQRGVINPWLSSSCLCVRA